MKTPDGDTVAFFLANESYSQYSSVYVNYGDFAQVARLSFICLYRYICNLTSTYNYKSRGQKIREKK